MKPQENKKEEIGKILRLTHSKTIKRVNEELKKLKDVPKDNRKKKEYLCWILDCSKKETDIY